MSGWRKPVTVTITHRASSNKSIHEMQERLNAKFRKDVIAMENTGARVLAMGGTVNDVTAQRYSGGFWSIGESISYYCTSTQLMQVYERDSDDKSR